MLRPGEKDRVDPMEILQNFPQKGTMSESEFKRLAHLPLWTLFYLSLQRKMGSTPVTALELAAYLELEVEVVEELLVYLEKKGLVRAFSEDLPAYSLCQELSQINVKDLFEILGEFSQLLRQSGAKLPSTNPKKSNAKYRRIYSELASEMLQLFGSESVNELPI